MKRALVISGGGSKGAFAVGVLKKLFSLYPKLDFDILVGTSTGSLIVPMVAVKEMKLLEDLYTKQKTENIVKMGRLGDRLSATSIFDATPLQGLIKQYYNDAQYNAIKNSGKKVYLNTTCLQTKGVVVFTTDKQPAPSNKYTTKTVINADHFQRAILASANQPVFMQPITVNKNVPGEPNPEFQFVDGGVREYAGIEVAIDNGATEIFTILLSAEDSLTDKKPLTDLFSILQRTIDIFTEDVGLNDVVIPQQYNEALAYIEAVKQKMIRSGIPAEKVKDYFTIRGRENPYEEKIPIPIHIIRPSAPLNGGPGGLNFDPTIMTDMVSKGASMADQFVASLKPAAITWA